MCIRDRFVTVEHELDTERRVSAHFDGEVTPLGVDEGKVVMIDVGPGLLALQVGAPLLQVVTFQTRAGALATRIRNRPRNCRSAGRYFSANSCLR